MRKFSTHYLATTLFFTLVVSFSSYGQNFTINVLPNYPSSLDFNSLQDLNELERRDQVLRVSVDAANPHHEVTASLEENLPFPIRINFGYNKNGNSSPESDFRNLSNQNLILNTDRDLNGRNIFNYHFNLEIGEIGMDVKPGRYDLRILLAFNFDTHNNRTIVISFPINVAEIMAFDFESSNNVNIEINTANDILRGVVKESFAVFLVQSNSPWLLQIFMEQGSLESSTSERISSSMLGVREHGQGDDFYPIGLSPYSIIQDRGIGVFRPVLDLKVKPGFDVAPSIYSGQLNYTLSRP